MRPDEFFMLLYPCVNNNYWLAIWTKQNKATISYPATPEGFIAAAREAEELAKKGKDVYFGVGLRRRQMPRNRRGELRDIAAVPCFWADVDTAEGAHAGRTEYPPPQEALDALLGLPVPPTILVHTGGGLHAYWLFSSLWELPDGYSGQRDFHRQEAALRLARFQEALRTLWGGKSWKLDNTADLPRILRVPGTMNWKNPENPLPVRVVHIDAGHRYEVNELSSWADGVLAQRGRKGAAGGQASGNGSNGSVDNPAAVVNELVAWWNEGGRHARALALAGFLAKRGVGEEEAKEIVRRLAEKAGDGEVKDRLRAVADTYQKLADGRQVVGLSAMPEELAAKLDALVRKPDPVRGVLGELGDPPAWPRLFEPAFLRRLASLREADLQRLLAEVKARGGTKVVSAQKLEKMVKQARAKAKAEERGLAVLPGGGDPSVEGKFITERFPPAREIIPEDFPFPETGERRTFYDIRGGRVVKVTVRHDEDGGEREEVYPITDTVVLLKYRVDPVERDAGIEKWSVAWWERDRWRQADVPARYLFDRKRVGELVDIGLPVSSANVDALVEWLHALRTLAVLGHQGAPELPTVHAVNRCGWHKLDNELFFVWGKEILRPRGTAAADAGDREEIQPDAGRETDADIRWVEDLSALERQILSSFRCGGDPGEHKRFLVEAAIKYPQIAFGLGCAAGAPLLRVAQSKGLIDVGGFCVFMVPRASGRSRHQGKSTWNAVVASLYGWPAVGETGRLRFADRTRVAAGVLFAANADLTVHIEELQHLARVSKKEMAQELEHLIHQVANTLDRERGAKSGGGRRTRSFNVVLFGTSEVDVMLRLPAEGGVHDRVLKLPPLLPDETDQNRDEAERLLQLAMSHYGHAGREYLSWLVRKVAEGGDGFITEGVKDAIKELRRNLPMDARRASAGRIATRAAVGFCGLMLLLEAWGVGDPAVVDAAAKNFLLGWEMVMDGIPEETVADRALAAVRAYVAASKELIEGFRAPDAKPPQRWAGSVVEVKNDHGQRVQVVALTEPAFAEAVTKEPFELDVQHALQALAAARHIVTKQEKKPDGRVANRAKLLQRVAGIRTYCVCVPVNLLEDRPPTQTANPPADMDDDSGDTTKEIPF